MGDDTMAGDKFGISVSMTENYAVVAKMLFVQKEVSLCIPRPSCPISVYTVIYWEKHSYKKFCRAVNVMGDV